jgi:hypothetical protein
VDRGYAVRAGDDAVALLGETDGEIPAYLGLVIDDQYAAFQWDPPVLL